MPAKIPAPEGQRWCKRGQHFVDLDNFHNSKKYGKVHTCKPCCKDRDAPRDHYLKNHGVPKSVFDDFVEAQKGLCAACGYELARPCLDHCHETGQFRGVLCHACNIALGMLRDDPKRIQGLAEYLGAHS